MKRILSLLIPAFLLNLTALTQNENNTEPAQRAVREGTEWIDVWVPNANTTGKPRVLLVGDSIVKGYYGAVEKQLAPVATCAKLATSACVSDPAFVKQLESVLTGYKYSVIHFNNGLHGFDYSEKEYGDAYENALKVIRKLQPDAKIVVTLTTPLNSTSAQNKLNPRVDARNQIARDLAKKFNAEIDDLHSISKEHPEYYTDAYHYKPNAISLQAVQVANLIKGILPQGAKQ